MFMFMKMFMPISKHFYESNHVALVLTAENAKENMKKRALEACRGRTCPKHVEFWAC